MSPILDDVVICLGGPLDGQGFTLGEWAHRKAAGGAAAQYEPGGEVPSRILKTLGERVVLSQTWPEGARSRSLPLEPALGDVQALLGDPCSLCGWYRGKHRPEIRVGYVIVRPCPSLGAAE